MKRRDFILKSGLVTAASLTNFPLHSKTGINTDIAAKKEQLKAKKMLFFDLYQLDYWDNCNLEQGILEYIPEATFTDDSISKEGAAKPNVYFDNQSKIWRMLYNAGWGPVNLMSAVSNDGIKWIPDEYPEISLGANVNRIAANHIFHLDNSAAGDIYHDPVAKDGFHFKMPVQISGKKVYERAKNNPNHQLHAAAQKQSNYRTFHEGRMLVSEDGLKWNLHPAYTWSRADWQPEPPYFVFYNKKLNVHSMIVRTGWGDRRLAIQTTPDFQTWSEPELLLQMDPIDTAPVGFYAMPVVPYDKMYIGLLWNFHNSSSKPVESFNQFYGTMDAQLTYSYDGIRFFRGLRKPVLPNNPAPMHGCSQIRAYSIIELDDEIRVYSGSSRAPHGMERAKLETGKTIRAVVIHRLRKDGWMYLTSKGHWARFQTKPVTLFLPEISLNAAADFGEVRYQITNVKSEPVEGFTFDDCVPLKNNDALNWRVKWKNADLKKLIGKSIRIELVFYNAKIYSLTAAYHMLDAQDYWLLEGQNPIDPTRFDY